MRRQQAGVFSTNMLYWKTVTYRYARLGRWFGNSTQYRDTVQLYHPSETYGSPAHFATVVNRDRSGTLRLVKQQTVTHLGIDIRKGDR